MRRLIALGSCFLGLLAGAAIITPSVNAGVHFNSYVVEVNGQIILHPQGLVQHGTTYMPVKDVLNVLDNVKVKGAWSSGNLLIGTPIPVDARPQHGPTGEIYLNGRSFARIPLYMPANQSTDVSSTYIPIWYVMRALEQSGDRSTWNGQRWSISDVRK